MYQSLVSLKTIRQREASVNNTVPHNVGFEYLRKGHSKQIWPLPGNVWLALLSHGQYLLCTVFIPACYCLIQMWRFTAPFILDITSWQYELFFPQNICNSDFICQLLEVDVYESLKEGEVSFNKASRNSFKERQQMAGQGFPMKSAELSAGLQPPLGLAATSCALLILPLCPASCATCLPSLLSLRISVLAVILPGIFLPQINMGSLLVRSQGKCLLISLSFSASWLSLLPHSFHS